MVMGLLLLYPVALHAWDGHADDNGRHWVYALEQKSGRLVRIGDQSTEPKELAAKEEALAGRNILAEEKSSSAGSPIGQRHVLSPSARIEVLRGIGTTTSSIACKRFG